MEEEPGVDPARAALLGRAVEAWKRRLEDLGARNTLLYYRDLRQGTLDLTRADPNTLDSLLGGRTVALSRLVRTGESVGAAARRARAILSKATLNFEERGLSTLYLTWGMATWDNPRGTATPAAPMLLAELHLVPRGATAEDFDVSIEPEWDANPSLLRLLEIDHRIRLDGDEIGDIATSNGVDAACDLIDQAARPRVAGWQVSHRVVVGNFSYAKLPLVRDLDTALAEGVLADHDLLCAIAGDTRAAEAVRSRRPSVDIAEPDRTPPADEFLVLDADASQSYVINSVVKGADLVVEGPPGTGKSQTIANLIATLAARGERVLFVAEKRAAIDAVLDRLRHTGLDGIAIDLHGGAHSRRAVAQQLAQALDAAGAIPAPDVRDLHDRVARRRDELRRSTAAVHDPRAPWGVSLYDAQAAVLAAPPDLQITTRLTGTTLTGLDAETYRAARVDLDRFAALGGLDLRAGRGPWSSALLAGTVSTPDEAHQALAAVTGLSASLPAVLAWADVVDACGLRRPATIGEWAETLALIDGVHVTLARFTPEVFDPDLGTPLAELATALEPGARPGWRGGLSRVFSGRVRRARRTLTPLWRGGKPTVPDLQAAVAAAAAQQQTWAAMAADGGAPRLPDQVTGTSDSTVTLARALRDVETSVADADLDTRSLDELEAHLRALAADSATLNRLPELHAIHQRLLACGLGPLLDELTANPGDADDAVAALDQVWHASIIDYVSTSDPTVAGFDGTAHRRALDDFRDADRAHVATGPERVRRAVAEHTTRAREAYPDAAQIVEREARKKRRHIPVRDLFHQASDVLTAVKPCWAMSPLVVAQLLPLEQCFDVVIFDEASQVTPADAVGALLRAHRAVVAGDTRQLPPTSFFASSTSEDEDNTGEEPDQSLVTGMESVLDVLASLLPPPHGTRTLGWHYRSRDERLIAFSNAQPSLYNGSLTTFPGVTGGRCPEHVLVEARTGADDTDSSAAEVRAVVELILDHATSRPDLSLGVITMGITHADRISEALRLARGSRPDLNGFFDHGPPERSNPEPVFVKNLERVQGDERDAIILSIGYGKAPDGRMQYRFGPLNQEGGERRLNVAITRARHRMTLVSSFGSRDLDPTKLRAEGAQMLGRYLAYAESGGTDLGRVSRTKVALNPFERDVEKHLTAAGIPLVPQFGASGYWIDFAAQHPSRPGEMVLAVECDGVSYHRSPTVRDRDRLRQEHLERLGWRFHRIWSTDWFRNRDSEVRRARAAYDSAVQEADRRRTDAAAGRAPAANRTPSRPPEPVGSSPHTPPPNRSTAGPAATGRSTARPAATGTTTPPARRRGGRPALVAGQPITAYSHESLVSLARWIESDTLLRTEDELIDALMQELGFKRRGTRIVAALTAAIADARANP